MMKFITKLQSYTDVITNSSSTVFIMRKEDAKFYKEDAPYGCCRIAKINKQWLLDNRWEWELVFDFLNINKNTLSKEHKGNYYSYWDDPDEEVWELWIDNNLALLQKKLFGLYFVDIEDHFEDACEYICNAADHALISVNRH